MRKTLSSALNVYRQYRAAKASHRAYKIIRYVVVFVVAVYLLLLTFPQILFAREVPHKALSFAQSGAPPSCAKHDSGTSYSSGHRTAIHFVEVCKVPNPEGKPALSVILSSDDGDHAIRVYSNDATKPLILDGIYVERNGEKKFILHRDNIEWANGSRTQLDTVDPKKKKKLIEVFEAAFQLLKDADEFHRIPMRHSQDRLNFWRVFNFMFNYQIDGKH